VIDRAGIVPTSTKSAGGGGIFRSCSCCAIAIFHLPVYLSYSQFRLVAREVIEPRLITTPKSISFTTVEFKFLRPSRIHPHQPKLIEIAKLNLVAAGNSIRMHVENSPLFHMQPIEVHYSNI